MANTEWFTGPGPHNCGPIRFSCRLFHHLIRSVLIFRIMSLILGHINRGAHLAWRLPLASSLSRLLSGSAAAARIDDESDGRESISFKLEDLFKADDKSHLTPAAVVEQLDRFIIGQAEAKVSSTSCTDNPGFLSCTPSANSEQWPSRSETDGDVNSSLCY